MCVCHLILNTTWLDLTCYKTNASNRAFHDLTAVHTIVSSESFHGRARFFVLLTPHIFHPIFGVFPLDQIAHIRVSPSINLKLFGRDIIFEVFQSVWKTYVNVTDGQTHGQTTYCSMTALCVTSRGRNRRQKIKQSRFMAPVSVLERVWRCVMDHGYCQHDTRSLPTPTHAVLVHDNYSTTPPVFNVIFTELFVCHISDQ